MKFITSKYLVFISFLVGVCLNGLAQTSVPQGINYQAVARNSSGAILSNQSIAVKIGIRATSASGALEWEEIHSVSTNQFGLFNFVIGQGSSTGNGSLNSFALMNWAAAEHFIVTSIDVTGGTSFVALDTMQFWSVPYALHAASSGKPVQSIRLNDLADVDTIGVVNGYVLKWNGSTWKPALEKNSDSVTFALNANHAKKSDTATYALNQLSAIDTVNFAHYSDTVVYASQTSSATNSNYAIHSDTALYAHNTASVFNAWNLTGNSGTNPSTDFMGTIDSKDLVIKTNNVERVRILSNGKVGVGTATPTASFQVNGDDGLLATGNFGSGTAVSLGAGTRMHWYPKKAAFRVGYVSAAQWNDINVGNYSFSSGFTSNAAGAYSTAMGQFSVAPGANSVAMGYACNALNESTVALGSSNTASGVYSVSMGRGMTAADSGSVGIGYHSSANGKYSLAFGAYTNASGHYSTTMGYYASTNGKKGSFVYADNSSTSITSSTADNQFMVRASGGVVFYSNTGLTTGVSLAAGDGSWASVSDKHKKENFTKVDGNKILQGIEKLDVTSWNYKTQSPNIIHVGPMAQDFYSVFGFGESDTTITSIDIDGVNLMALKTLALKTKELKKSADEVAELKQKVASLEAEKKLLEKRITSIEKQFMLVQPTALKK